MYARAGTDEQTDGHIHNINPCACVPRVTALHVLPLTMQFCICTLPCLHTFLPAAETIATGGSLSSSSPAVNWKNVHVLHFRPEIPFLTCDYMTQTVQGEKRVAFRVSSVHRTAVKVSKVYSEFGSY